MSFIADAKEILNAEELAQLELLARKSADFDTTSDEDIKLFELKKKVKEVVAKRDKMKNLAVIGNKAYALDELLEASGYTHQDIFSQYENITDLLIAAGYDEEKQQEHFENAFKKPPKPKSEVYFGEYVINSVGQKLEFKEGSRINKDAKEHVQKMPVKDFLNSIQPEAWAWISEINIPKQGPYKGKELYSNAKETAKRLELKEDELIKAIIAKKKADEKKPDDKK